MRGTPDRQLSMLSSLSTEDLIPAGHPIRKIRVVVDTVLAEMDGLFEAMYSTRGRPSVPPEVLLKSTVLMAMYSMRSERAFCERLNYDMLFKWFLDLPIDAPSFDASTFSKNRQRLLGQNIADEFFAAVVRQAKLRRYMSSDHFSVDGTLLEAWASHKSFKPKNPDTDGDVGGPKGRNAEVGWHGQKRSNDTHESTTESPWVSWRLLTLETRMSPCHRKSHRRRRQHAGTARRKRSGRSVWSAPCARSWVRTVGARSGSPTSWATGSSPSGRGSARPTSTMAMSGG